MGVVDANLLSHDFLVILLLELTTRKYNNNGKI